MFVISVFDLMWRFGVTRNAQTRKRFNGGEFSLPSGGLLGTWVDVACEG